MRKGLLIKIIWWIYILLLFGIVIIKFRGSISELLSNANTIPFGINYNIVPFSTIRVFLNNFSESWAKINIFGNIIPFMPFGFLLPMISKKVNSFLKVFIIGLGFILFAEIFQFLTRLGGFDVDDIILNMFGISIGYLSRWFGIARRESKC